MSYGYRNEMGNSTLLTLIRDYRADQRYRDERDYRRKIDDENRRIAKEEREYRRSLDEENREIAVEEREYRRAITEENQNYLRGERKRVSEERDRLTAARSNFANTQLQELNRAVSDMGLEVIDAAKMQQRRYPNSPNKLVGSLTFNQREDGAIVPGVYTDKGDFKNYTVDPSNQDSQSVWIHPEDEEKLSTHYNSIVQKAGTLVKGLDKEQIFHAAFSYDSDGRVRPSTVEEFSSKIKSTTNSVNSSPQQEQDSTPPRPRPRREDADTFTGAIMQDFQNAKDYFSSPERDEGFLRAKHFKNGGSGVVGAMAEAAGEITESVSPHLLNPAKVAMYAPKMFWNVLTGFPEPEQKAVAKAVESEKVKITSEKSGAARAEVRARSFDFKTDFPAIAAIREFNVRSELENQSELKVKQAKLMELTGRIPKLKAAIELYAAGGDITRQGLVNIKETGNEAFSARDLIELGIKNEAAAKKAFKEDVELATKLLKYQEASHKQGSTAKEAEAAALEQMYELTQEGFALGLQGYLGKSGKLQDHHKAAAKQMTDLTLEVFKLSAVDMTSPAARTAIRTAGRDYAKFVGDGDFRVGGGASFVATRFAGLSADTENGRYLQQQLAALSEKFGGEQGVSAVFMAEYDERSKKYKRELGFHDVVDIIEELQRYE